MTKRCILFSEQQLPILRQRPNLIVHHQFQIIYMSTDFIQERSDRVVISNRTLAHVGNLVRFLARINHIIHLLRHNRDVARYRTYQAARLLRQFRIFLIAEGLFQTGQVLQQDSLVTDDNRDDMVQ